MSIRTTLAVLIGLFSSISHPCFSQLTKQDINEAVKAEITPLNAKIDELAKAVAANNNAEKSGKFRVTNDKNITVYNGTNKNNESNTGTTIDIKEIKITCQDGLVVDIQVITTKGKVFSNSQTSIPVNDFTGRRNDNLASSDKNDDYIKCADFLIWIRETGTQPDDKIFSLSKEGDEIELDRSNGIDQVINVRLYSDLLGVFGERPNGLVQTEATFRTIVNESNFYNKAIWVFRDFRFDIIFARFDKKLQNTYYQANDINSFSRAELYQRSYLNAEAQLTLLHANVFGSKKSFYLDFPLGAGVSISNLSAIGKGVVTQNNDTTTRTINLPYLAPSIVFGGSLGSNAGYHFSTKLLFQYAPGLNNIYAGGAVGREFLIVEPEVFWNPLGAPASRFFGRVRYNKMLNSDKDFFQAQVGFTFSISKALSTRAKGTTPKTNNQINLLD